MTSKDRPHFYNFKLPIEPNKTANSSSNMQSTKQPTKGASLEMHANDSTGFNEVAKNQKMVTKRDGSQQPFSTEHLTKSLTSMCEGLDMNYINIDIIVGKVTMGLPQGKYTCVS